MAVGRGLRGAQSSGVSSRRRASGPIQRRRGRHTVRVHSCADHVICLCMRVLTWPLIVFISAALLPSLPSFLPIYRSVALVSSRQVAFILSSKPEPIWVLCYCTSHSDLSQQFVPLVHLPGLSPPQLLWCVCVESGQRLSGTTMVAVCALQVGLAQSLDDKWHRLHPKAGGRQAKVNASTQLPHVTVAKPKTKRAGPLKAAAMKVSDPTTPCYPKMMHQPLLCRLS